MVKNIRRGDIYRARLPHSDGSVQTGTRPVVIVQNNIGNHYSPTVIVAVMTTKPKDRNKRRNQPTHMTCNAGSPSLILCEQVMTLDKSDLIEYITSLDDDKLDELDEKLSISLGLHVNYQECTKEVYA